jgi:uncharacterized protein YjbI with pentapeptide repeats
VGALVTGDLADAVADGLHVRGSRLEGLVLAGAEIERFRADDVVLDTCDLSGAVLAEASLRRVLFRGCRMRGVVLAGGRLEDVRFEACQLDEASLRMVWGARVELDGCSLVGADLYEAVFPGVSFDRCDLTGASVDHADLRDARLHGSNLLDLRGRAVLDGAAVDATQLVPFALWQCAALGVRVVGVGPGDD